MTTLKNTLDRLKIDYAKFAKYAGVDLDSLQSWVDQGSMPAYAHQVLLKNLNHLRIKEADKKA